MTLEDLKCECCNSPMLADFSNNVFCGNKDCLLYDKCFSDDYYRGRAEAKADGRQPQRKERMKQGWANEFD